MAAGRSDGACRVSRVTAVAALAVGAAVGCGLVDISTSGIAIDWRGSATPAAGESLTLTYTVRVTDDSVRGMSPGRASPTTAEPSACSRGRGHPESSWKRDFTPVRIGASPSY